MSSIKAGDWVKDALPIIGGKGGGKPTVAQGQGPGIDKVRSRSTSLLS